MKRLAIAQIFLFVGALHAQTPGSIDPAFNPSDIGYGRGDGFYGYLSCGTIQTDGKILVGGDFTGYSGLGGGTTTIGLKRLARLNVDGTLDQSLAIGSGFNAGTVRKILVQADGKIIALGNFTSYNGSTAVCIARLSSTGAIDPTFITGTGFLGGYPEDAVLLPDGKIVVVGTFTTYNGSACGKVARLNADGTFDATFVTGTGFTGSGVSAIARQTDGSLLIGGEFTAFNGTPRSNIVRISSAGALDATYHPGGVGMDDGGAGHRDPEATGRRWWWARSSMRAACIKRGVVRACLPQGRWMAPSATSSTPGSGPETRTLRTCGHHLHWRGAHRRLLRYCEWHSPGPLR
jgi:uncharacterized delta-60 repeat protein